MVFMLRRAGGPRVAGMLVLVSSLWSFIPDLTVAVLTLIVISPPAEANVMLPTLISDNMVLQQGRPVAVLGKADPGERVRVSLGREEKTSTADGERRWRIMLGPLGAGGPWEMTVVGSNTLKVHNVMVGEVWLGAGQSNMEMTVGQAMNAKQEISAADCPEIRYFKVKKAVASRPQTEVEGQWVVASPRTVPDFSAVAYFFLRDLHKSLRIPLGIIESSWGGTPAEAWTSAGVLSIEPELRPLLADWQKAVADYQKLLDQFRGSFDQFQHRLDQWISSSQQAEEEGKLMLPPPSVPSDLRASPWRATGL